MIDKFQAAKVASEMVLARRWAREYMEGVTGLTFNEWLDDFNWLRDHFLTQTQRYCTGCGEPVPGHLALRHNCQRHWRQRLRARRLWPQTTHPCSCELEMRPKP